jgi:hypothetical protein
MAQAIVVTGANFISNGLGRAVYLTSDRTNLVGEFIFGRDAATSTYNSATSSSAPASAVGTLTYSDHYANPAGANFFSTSITGATNLTMLSIVAPGVSAETEIYFSSTDGAGTNGFYLGNQGGDAFISVINSAGAQQKATLGAVLAAPLSEFRAIAGRIGGTTSFTLEVDEFKGGARLQAASATATGSRVVDSQTICIGSLNGSAVFNSAKDTSAVLIWHRLLTDAELLAAYLECRNVLSRMGINC